MLTLLLVLAVSLLSVHALVAAEPTYRLAVQNGTGSGNYQVGTEASIVADPAPPNKVFSKWVVVGGGNLVNANSASTAVTVSSHDITVTATYRSAATYTTKYYQGATLLKTVSAKEGTALSSSYAPKKTGYTFAGWYSAKSGGTKITKVTANRSVYARYTINKYITNYYNGSALVTTKVANYNTNLVTGPKKTGYTFLGWYTAKTGGAKVTKVNANRTVYTRYKINQYTTKYYNGSALYKTTKTNYNTNLLAGPKKTGYTFLGWYTAKTGGAKITKVTGNKTVHARYKINQYTTKYYNGATLLKSVTAKYNSALSKGIAPQKSGYRFAGWYSAKTGGTKVTKVTANRTVYARYIKQISVSYHSAEGILIKKVTVDTGSLPNDLLVPLPPAGCEFIGWYSAPTANFPEGELVTILTGNQSLFARYRRIDSLEPVFVGAEEG